MEQFKIEERNGRYIPMVERAGSWKNLVMVDNIVEPTGNLDCVMAFEESCLAHNIIERYKLQG